MNIDKRILYLTVAALFVSLAGCKNLLGTVQGKT